MSFYDNRTFCCPIPSVIILMLNKSDPSYMVIQFCLSLWRLQTKSESHQSYTIIGKVSAQPHTIVKQICFPNGNVLFLSLFPLFKNWMHNVGWGCAEILPHYLSLEGTVFISECCKYLSRMNVDDGSYKQMLNLKTIYHGSFQEEATIFYVILRKRHCTIQNSLVAETYSRTSVLRYTTNRCTIIWQNMAMKRFTCSLKLRPAGKMRGMI